MNRKFQKEKEITLEYILPDYLGDVRKVLKTSASLTPTGHFTSGEEVLCAGVVSFEMIYLDAEGKLSDAAFTSDYELSFPIDEEKYICSYIFSELASYSMRLTGPRKMSAKATVLLNINVAEAASYELTGSGKDDDTLEMISTVIKTERIVPAESNEREYAEELFEFENMSESDIEIITSSAFAKIKEATPLSDGVNIKGELIVGAIVRTADSGAPFAIRKSVPFDETVKIEAEAEGSALANVYVTSSVLSLVTDEDKVKLNSNIIAEFTGMLIGAEELSVPRDAYLKGCESLCAYDELTFSENVESRTESMRIDMPISLDELGSAHDIMAASATFKVRDVEPLARGVKIKGEMQVSGIACEINEDGERILNPLRFSKDFEQNVNLTSQIDSNTVIFAQVLPSFVDFSISEDEATLTVEPTVTLMTSREHNERVLASCDAIPDTAYETGTSVINVYYPEPEETLFDVAKRYHTTAAKIALDNSIAEPVSSFDGSVELSRGFDRLIIR